MEKNQFEELEEVEKIEKVEKPALEQKEYEKLLQAENNRKLVEKAQTLINFGCFDQREVTTFDFSEYDYIEGRKFKDRFNLYVSKTTNELVYVCPLVENNEGDSNENKAMKPYAYDCIFVESMDEETYKQVIAAGKNNVATWPQKLIKASWVTFIAYASITVFILLYHIVYNIDSAIQNNDSNLVTPVVLSFVSCGALLAGVMISLPLLLLASLKYKDYRKN